MELQVMMEASTETLNGTMWLGHSPSPPYQRLSPPVRHEGRDVITAQQVSMGYHVSDSGILWHDKRESPKTTPDANDHQRTNGGSNGNSPTSEEESFNQSSNGLKRRSTEANQSIGELDRKHARRDGSIGSNGSAQWSSRQVEELAEHFAADFDGSFSALAANDLANAVASYNMSLNHVTQRNLVGSYQNGTVALPVEPDSNNNSNNGNATTTNTAAVKASNNNSGDNIAIAGNGANGDRAQSTTSLHQLLYSGNDEYPPISSSGNQVSSSQQGNEFNEDSRFQYVLAAATSIATKLNEETLTYLNQGQSYEIKLKKLGDLSAYRGKILKSSIRICFHERRLQYTEKEQMIAWQRTRPGERLLEVDVPLSYGMMDVSQNTVSKNIVEFMWDPTKEVGVYIKVNCISTEFTPKKHGGEKGVPFRIQVVTKLPGGPRLHAASCQIKVFKLKGADRKHKQDRDKIRRRPPHEQDNYQPSYDCTVLSDIPLEALTPASPLSQNEGSPYPPTDAISQPSPNNVSAASPPLTVVPVFVSVAAPGGQISSSEQTVQDDTNDSVTTVNRQSSSPVNLPDQTTCNDVTPSIGPSELPADANAVQTCAWLRVNRFQAFETVFANFSAADILRLTRDDLIQICGLANGIRLFNALQSKPPTPKLTLNVALEGGNSLMWHALHLQTRTSGALSSKLITTFNLPSDRLHSVLLQGPQGIHLVASNELVAYMKDDRMFLVEIIRDSSSDRYKLLLKPFFRQIRNDNEARIDNETVH
ncbi:transcription factor CP2-like protein 1 isoform X2 [Diachasmimorpha longicaudata]|uniref:transcription factor CP2-like protein 1 isoform X2 n=1 Tax=Diachasmimorpha longicaudata TaxID=58733 RepID=UPI0030B8F1CF